MSAQDFILTEQELKEITGYVRPAYQSRILKSLGIPCRKRPDNTLLVLRRDCQQQSTAHTDHPKRKSERK